MMFLRSMRIVDSLPQSEAYKTFENRRFSIHRKFTIFECFVLLLQKSKIFASFVRHSKKWNFFDVCETLKPEGFGALECCQNSWFWRTENQDFRVLRIRGIGNLRFPKMQNVSFANFISQPWKLKHAKTSFFVNIQAKNEK